MNIGIDFQTLVSSWYIDGSNFCFEARYKSNQDFEAPAAPPTLMFMAWSEPPGGHHMCNKYLIALSHGQLVKCFGLILLCTS